MDDNALNRLLEETFQNIVHNDGPNILEMISQSVRDISNISIPNSNINIGINHNNNEPINNQSESTTDISMNPLPDTTRRETQTDRSHVIDLLEDFSLRWFMQMNNYHSCVRDYHKNMLQMNRISSSLLRNISLEHFEQSHTTPYLRGHQPHGGPMFQVIPNSIEIQGFSIPIPSMQSATSPSNVFPTISQIMNAVDIFIYNEENQIRVTETRCPISLEDFVIGEELCEIKHCHHIFKWSSLQGWFSRNTCCPVCRYDIHEEDDNS